MSDHEQESSMTAPDQSLEPTSTANAEWAFSESMYKELVEAQQRLLAQMDDLLTKLRARLLI